MAPCRGLTAMLQVEPPVVLPNVILWLVINANVMWWWWSAGGGHWGGSSRSFAFASQATATFIRDSRKFKKTRTCTRFFFLRPSLEYAVQLISHNTRFLCPVGGNFVQYNRKRSEPWVEVLFLRNSSNWEAMSKAILSEALQFCSQKLFQLGFGMQCLRLNPRRYFDRGAR